jgi:selenocysteine-specific elongation factor
MCTGRPINPFDTLILMKSIIVGTAGHIDHGKTSLVKALTGIDADRLEEEKRRGITIDLGFANLELTAANGELLKIGFIDVPGHERFVRNMLAGVGGIDLVFFVIAADESIKPQTREHFDICRLLNIQRGIVVLTKSDTVDSETLEVVRLEVEDFLLGSFLDPSTTPIVAVSSLSGAGLENLKREMSRLALEVPGKSSEALLRLPIDRVFTMKGFGTVVTGTLISGMARNEQELEVAPANLKARVRGVQVHGAATEHAIAGQRTALNLSGVATDQLTRGMTLIQPDTLRSTRRLDVHLELLPDAKKLRNHSRVHLHAYSSETIAEVVLLQGVQIEPGKSAFVQLRTADPILVVPGDHFIIRQYSPVTTIGGGVVLDAFPQKRRANERQELIAFLERLDSGSAQELLLARVLRKKADGLSLSDAIAETGWTTQRIRNEAEALIPTKLIWTGDRLLATEWSAKTEQEIVQVVQTFHKGNPLVAGISKEELRGKLELNAGVFDHLLTLLVKAKKLEVSGEQVRAAGRSVMMTDEEARAKRIIEEAFASAGLKVPAMKDVLAGLKIDAARSQKIITLLLRDRVLVKLADDLVFHRDALEGLRKSVVDQKKASPRIDVARFKDLTGVSRKYAIPLLEYLDRERVTRRVGDERIIL